MQNLIFGGTGEVVNGRLKAVADEGMEMICIAVTTLQMWYQLTL